MLKVRLVSGVVLLSAMALAGAINISGYAQARWEGDLAGDGMHNSFLIKRAYLGARGDVTDWLSYKILLTFPEASVSLFDCYIDVKPSKFFCIRVGQFQQPIGMEKLTSSSMILFPERSFASGFTMDRDLGIMLAGGYKLFSLQAGVFNGAGRNTLDDNDAKDIVARLTLRPLEYLHIGGAYAMGQRTDTTQIELVDINRWGAELAFTPWNLWLVGEFMGGETDTTSHTLYYAELGWLFTTNLGWLYGVQPAARYEVLDPNIDTDADSESILTGGVNVHFLPKHRAKLALCYRMFLDDQDDDQVIAQLQVKFP